MVSEKRGVGENKLERLIRTMKAYEEEIKLIEGRVGVFITSEGRASLSVLDEIVVTGSVSKIVEFLESGQLHRTLMVRG